MRDTGWSPNTNAHKRQNVKIHYFLHPLYPNEVAVVHERRLFSEKLYGIRLFDNSVVFIPEWMTDPDVCERCVLQEKPECAVAALLELRRFLDDLAL